jgi:hypothetical protein
MVFTSESPSAPASTTARAFSAMSQVAGDSFAYRGFRVPARAAWTSSEEASGASSTFGHERFNSIVVTSSCASRRSHVEA